ncbi:MAG TPA: hypothetical protein VLH77_06810 [Gammaproteobacteria bacterium]|nr:hypothetical protein [Gammaproteobacteria bacterium]
MRPSLTSGVSLIEVLLSLFLLSLLLLGLDVMELEALRLYRQAYFASLAEQQLENMEERLRILDVQGGLNGELFAWNQENKELLPQGLGSVTGTYPVYLITLSWGNKEEKTAGCLRAQFVI